MFSLLSRINGDNERVEQWLEVVSWELRAFVYHNFLVVWVIVWFKKIVLIVWVFLDRYGRAKLNIVVFYSICLEKKITFQGDYSFFFQLQELQVVSFSANELWLHFVHAWEGLFFA